jgi:hypothetical protein
MLTATYRLKHATHLVQFQVTMIVTNLVHAEFKSKLLPYPPCCPPPSATSIPEWMGIASLSTLLDVSILVHFPLRTAVTIGRTNNVNDMT